MLAHDGEGWVPGARNWLAITCVMHSALTLSSAPMRGCLQLVGTRQVDLASDDPGPSAQQLCDLEQVVGPPSPSVSLCEAGTPKLHPHPWPPGGAGAHNCAGRNEPQLQEFSPFPYG